MSDTMKIADLVRGRRKRVKIRVPAELQSELGSTARGTVEQLLRRDSVAWVRVRVDDSVYEFRPQDLSPVR